MNYIGHILLTYPHPGITVGNIAGDMVRSTQLHLLPSKVSDGVHIHRVIDEFTDSHDVIRTLVRQLRPRHGKYAPVVLDIVIDHVLCMDWEDYCDDDFDDFAAWVYDTIQGSKEELPGFLAMRLAAMARHQWLHQYITSEGLLRVLQRMDQRARFPSAFSLALLDLEHMRAQLREGIAEFFPQARKFVSRQMEHI